MSLDTERQFFLLKADAAEERAVLATTDVERIAWRNIAKEYSKLAVDARQKNAKIKSGIP